MHGYGEKTIGAAAARPPLDGGQGGHGSPVGRPGLPRRSRRAGLFSWRWRAFTAVVLAIAAVLFASLWAAGRLVAFRDASRSAIGSGQGPASGSPSGFPAARPSLPAPGSPAPPLPPVPARLVFHGPRERRAVAITFDACQDEYPRTFDLKTYDILEETRTPATVFMGGKWMEEHPESTKLMAANPLIELGNHSYIHPHFTKISDERVIEEVRKTQDIQYRLTGKRGHVFRFPFGDHHQKDVELVASLGLTPIQWEVVSGDPDPNVSAKAMIREVLAQARPGSIIIFHINGRGVHTAEALPAVIEGLRERGFQLVTVSELLGLR